MKVLFVTSELAGYVKTGGLGDVSAAIPRALRARGIDAQILLPFYGAAERRQPSLQRVGMLDGSADIPPCELAAGEAQDGTPVYFVVAPELYERPGTPYADRNRKDWPDSDLRFARLALAAAQIAAGEAGLAWSPDIVHANDWPAGLVAFYLARHGGRIPVLYTIHNLAHQGLFPAARATALGIPPSALTIDGMEFYGQLSLMKAGLAYSTHVSTVSPNYAREITTPAFGCGLDGLLGLLASSGRLSGIAHGVGDEWSPDNDAHLLQTYPPNVSRAKRRHANFVRQRFDLDPGPRPLFAMVSRFAHQKGVDLALDGAASIAAAGAQVVLVGEGEPHLEEAAKAAAALNPGSIGVAIAFDEMLAHRLTAASDFYLMPSRFEPCGLNQMYAQRYGSLPIANATGGLVDTIEDGKTGFLYEGSEPAALDRAIARALRVYLDSKAKRKMRAAAMAKDFSWEKAAHAYDALYRRLAAEPAVMSAV
jgi:starch synthase